MTEKIPNGPSGENRPRQGRRARPLGRWVLVAAALLVVAGVALYLADVPAVAGGPGEPEEVEVEDPGAAPVPVLLVPGWRDTVDELEPFRKRFVEAGWPEERVRAMEFRDPVGGNVQNAREIAEAVTTFRAGLGTERVDVVAHSMGGLAVRYYLRFLDGEAHVRRVAFLGTPHRGTVLASLAWGEGAEDMIPGSEFLETLNEGPAVPEGVEGLALRTPLDLRILPASSAILPGVHNVEVCCPTHPGMIDDDNTFQAVEQFLRAGPDLPDPYIPWWDELVQRIEAAQTG